jgi:hypothetical protein
MSSFFSVLLTTLVPLKVSHTFFLPGSRPDFPIPRRVTRSPSTRAVGASSRQRRHEHGWPRAL